MTRVLARCPDTGIVLSTGIDWAMDGPDLPSNRIDVFCPECGKIHHVHPYLESAPVSRAGPLTGLENAAPA